MRALFHFPQFSRSAQTFAIALLVSGAERLKAAEPVDLTPVKQWIARSGKIKSLIAEFRQERQLRTVKKPLESTGRVWIQVGGAFRWQVGDPPRVVAVLGPGGDFTLLNESKKTAELISSQSLENDSSGQSLAFLKAGFPGSLEEFQKKFEVREIAAEGEWDRVELKPAGGGGSLAVLKMLLYLHHDRHTLGSIHVYLRDGSRISTTFTAIQENPEIPASRFTVDLTGYEVKRK